MLCRQEISKHVLAVELQGICRTMVRSCQKNNFPSSQLEQVQQAADTRSGWAGTADWGPPQKGERGDSRS